MFSFYKIGEATLCASSATPNAVVQKHAQDESAGIRFIMSGVEHNGRALKQGDGMCVPRGAEYEFQMSARGVSLSVTAINVVVINYRNVMHLFINKHCIVSKFRGALQSIVVEGVAEKRRLTSPHGITG